MGSEWAIQFHSWNFISYSFLLKSYSFPILPHSSRISVFVAKKHSRSILRKMLLECFFVTKTLMRERITENTRVQFPVGTKKFGEGILSTSQAGLRRAAPSSYTALWQKAGDQPSYREPSPFGGCNFLSQDAPRVFL